MSRGQWGRGHVWHHFLWRASILFRSNLTNCAFQVSLALLPGPCTGCDPGLATLSVPCPFPSTITGTEIDMGPSQANPSLPWDFPRALGRDELPSEGPTFYGQVRPGVAGDHSYLRAKSRQPVSRYGKGQIPDSFQCKCD